MLAVVFLLILLLVLSLIVLLLILVLVILALVVVLILLLIVALVVHSLCDAFSHGIYSDSREGAAAWRLRRPCGNASQRVR